MNQVHGIVVIFVYDAIVSLILLKIIDAVIGLRVSDEVERKALTSRCTAKSSSRILTRLR